MVIDLEDEESQVIIKRGYDSNIQYPSKKPISSLVFNLNIKEVETRSYAYTLMIFVNELRKSPDYAHILKRIQYRFLHDELASFQCILSG